MATTPFHPDDLTGLNHVALVAKDVEASVAFYRDFLGFEEATRLFDLKSGELMLAVMKINDDQTLEIFDGKRMDSDAPRPYQIALRTRSAEAAHANLRDRGYAVPPAVHFGQMKNRAFCAKEPAGVWMEFVETDPVTTPESWSLRDAGRFLGPNRISKRMSHAGVDVKGDPEAALKFFRDTLGFTEIWRGSKEEKAVSWIHLRFPNGRDTLELMLEEKVLPHICLEVPDLPAALAELETRKAKTRYPHPLEMKTGIIRKRLSNLFDPDGVRVELMEDRTVDGTDAPSTQAPIVPFRK